MTQETGEPEQSTEESSNRDATRPLKRQVRKEGNAGTRGPSEGVQAEQQKRTHVLSSVHTRMLSYVSTQAHMHTHTRAHTHLLSLSRTHHIHIHTHSTSRKVCSQTPIPEVKESSPLTKPNKQGMLSARENIKILALEHLPTQIEGCQPVSIFKAWSLQPPFCCIMG